MKKLVVFFVILLLLPSYGMAADCSNARNIVGMIQKEFASREEVTAITTEYKWRAGWYDLTYDQQYQMISMLAGLEICMRGGSPKSLPTVVVVYHGTDVAQADGLKGVRVLKSRP